MNKKKIVFFIGFYPQIVGGAEFQARLIADNLRNNYQIVFISYGHNHNAVEYIDGFKVYKLSLKKFIFHRFTFYFFIYLKIRKIIKYEKPDLIYQRVLNSFSFYISKISRTQKKPFVIHIADIKCLIFNKKSISSKVRKIFFKSINELQPNYICQTIEQQRLIENFRLVNTIVIPNIHNPIKFVNKKNITSNIVWIANVREFKQLELFIKLSQSLIEYRKFVFNVIGNINNDKYGKKLLKLLNESRVVYHGKKTNEWINNFLHDSLVLVNTSLPNSEGLPNTFIQSWLAGTPVISLNTDPNGYITKHNLGYYCSGNFECLIKSIIYVAEMPLVQYDILSNRCRDFAEHEFDVNTNISKINEFFKSSL